MRLADNIYRVLRKIGLRPPYRGIQDFEVDSSAVPTFYQEGSSRLADVFYSHQGRVVQKWTHYIDAYERHLSELVGTKFSLLEIGVFKGGSLELWRKYFGPDATIFGIDIDDRCRSFVDPPNQVRIGSQDDRSFLQSVVDEMQGVDVVIDDGSHYAPHQRRSFEVLFPLLRDGGLYILEDLHTAYWHGIYEGGYRRKGTAIELVKRLIDDMHANFHDRPELGASASQWIPAIHVYDSIVVIEKAKRRRPAHIHMGAAQWSASGLAAVRNGDEKAGAGPAIAKS